MATGRKKGSRNKVPLPSNYDGGEGAVNFYLAILSKAKQDDAQMWQAFQGTGLYQGINKDPLQVAWWVCEYLK